MLQRGNNQVKAVLGLRIKGTDLQNLFFIKNV